jgi:hypothetical protein
MSTKVIVELVAWNAAGTDSAGDRPQLPFADQSAHFVLGALELCRNLTDGQGCGPVHYEIGGPDQESTPLVRWTIRSSSLLPSAMLMRFTARI